MVVQILNDTSPQATEFMNKISKTVGKKDEVANVLTNGHQEVSNNPYNQQCGTPKAKKRNFSQNQQDLGSG